MVIFLIAETLECFEGMSKYEYSPAETEEMNVTDGRLPG
jgi:hypothetical protein